MPTFEHPISGELVAGMQLFPGAILQGKDLYASTTGMWGVCPCEEAVLAPTQTLWVRPGTSLTSGERRILAELGFRGGEWCIARREDSYFYIPNPEWNWDGRVELTRVQDESCLQQLVDFGYLVTEEVPISHATSDYSSVAWNRTENCVFALTDKGKTEH